MHEHQCNLAILDSKDMKVNLSTAIIVPVVILICAISVFAYIKYETSEQSQNATAPAGLRTDSTPLSELANDSADTQPTDNGTLGVSNSGSISLNQQKTEAASKSIPGPDDFEQYDKYKNDQNSYFAIIKEGSGEPAKQGEFVAVLYRGWLTDGTLFDQTRKNEQGQLQAFGLTLGQGQVIRGWEESIPGMKVGEMRRVIVPPAAGYGPSGQGVIPPNAVLVFDVEMVQIGETLP